MGTLCRVIKCSIIGKAWFNEKIQTVKLFNMKDT